LEEISMLASADPRQLSTDLALSIEELERIST